MSVTSISVVSSMIRAALMRVRAMYCTGDVSVCRLNTRENCEAERFARAARSATEMSYFREPAEALES